MKHTLSKETALKILSKKEITEIESLVQMEIDLITKGFEVSKEMGLVFFSNAITSFVENYLKPKYGDVILGMCSEYRLLLTGLLSQAPDEHKEILLTQVLSPTFRSVGDEELFEALNKLGSNGKA